MLYRYKTDEGRNVRQSAFWLGEAMIAFGCVALRTTLDRWNSLRAALFEGMSEVPILGTTLSASTLIAFGLFLTLSWVWIRFLGKAKTADHLIEVEGEMKKVTWPSFKEASNSSVIVIGTVLLLMAFLALSDVVLGRFFEWILWDTV